LGDAVGRVNAGSPGLGGASPSWSGDRMGYVHLKDVDGEVLRRSREAGRSFHDARSWSGNAGRIASRLDACYKIVNAANRAAAFNFTGCGDFEKNQDI
jgi:hypothetical protein